MRDDDLISYVIPKEEILHINSHIIDINENTRYEWNVNVLGKHGNSKNVLKGLKTAKVKKAITIGLLGNKGGKIKSHVDISIIVNSSSTPRIQEAHRTIYHIICELVEKEFRGEDESE